MNYSTNMLYVKIQEIIASLYLDEKLMERSKHLKELIIRDSFNGNLFIDHAVRDEEGLLVKKEDISEVCQYYAARFLRINLSEEKYSCLSCYP